MRFRLRQSLFFLMRCSVYIIKCSLFELLRTVCRFYEVNIDVKTVNFCFVFYLCCLARLSTLLFQCLLFSLFYVTREFSGFLHRGGAVYVRIVHEVVSRYPEINVQRDKHKPCNTRLVKRTIYDEALLFPRVFRITDGSGYDKK